MNHYSSKYFCTDLNAEGSCEEDTRYESYLLGFYTQLLKAVNNNNGKVAYSSEARCLGIGQIPPD